MIKLTDRQEAVLRRAFEIPAGGSACTTWLTTPGLTVIQTYAVVRQLEARGLMAKFRPDYTSWTPTRAGRELMQARGER